MTTIIFATNNQHKVDEIRSVTGDKFDIITLKEAGIEIDIPEPHDNLIDNAIEKARTIHQLTGKNVFSEDTGLEVAALNGEPGVKSARYAEGDRDFQANIRKLLKNLTPHLNRKAKFRTVICLIWNNEQHLFEGICEGEIINKQRGEKGFGYDPVFIPDGSIKTFAEMPIEEKSIFSHRRIATDKLINFLLQQE